MSTRARFRDALDEATRPGCDLVLDLSGTAFVDSTALTVLLRHRTEQRSAGHDLVLRAPSMPVAVVLRTAGLADVFTVEPAADGADDGHPQPTPT